MKASILIPAYNAAPVIAETLLSCVLQGENFVHEVIIIDDHSEDSTLEVAKAFAQAHLHLNFIIARNPGKGACSARNHAFSLASGEAIQWLDADDILGEGKLQKQLHLLNAHRNYLIASKWRRFSVDLRNLYPKEKGNWAKVSSTSTPLDWLVSERMVALHSWLGTRVLFEKTGPWDESLLINQDGEYFTRALAKSEGVIFEPESSVYYRSDVQGSVSQFKPEKAPSLFKSCESFERIALTLGSKEEVGNLISNKYQGFVYQVYPLVPELRKVAEQKIQQFGKPKEKYQSSFKKPFVKRIYALFGWRVLTFLRKLKSSLFPN